MLRGLSRNSDFSCFSVAHIFLRITFPEPRKVMEEASMTTLPKQPTAPAQMMSNPEAGDLCAHDAPPNPHPILKYHFVKSNGSSAFETCKPFGKAKQKS